MTWRDEYIRSATPEDLYLRSKYSYGGEVNPDVNIDPVDLLAVPGFQSLINRAAKNLSQMAAKQAWAEAIPEISAALKEMGNPITNSWKWLASKINQTGETLLPKTIPESIPVMAETNPAPIAMKKALKAGWNDLLGHWNLTFPYYDPTGKYPIMVLSKTPSASLRFLENIGQPYFDTRGFYGLASIMYQRPNRYLADLITINPGPDPAKTVLHELGHVAKNRVEGYPRLIERPEQYVKEARDIVASTYNPALHNELIQIGEKNPQRLETFWRRILNNEFEQWKETHPREAEFLFTSLGYKPRHIGEELWTRYYAKQENPWLPTVISPMEDSKISTGLTNVRNELIHPELKRVRPAIPLPIGVLENIEKSISQSSSLSEDIKQSLIEKIQNFKQKYDFYKQSIGE